MLRTCTLKSTALCVWIAAGISGCDKQSDTASTPKPSNPPAVESKPHFPGEPPPPPAVQMGPATTSKPTEVQPKPPTATTTASAPPAGTATSAPLTTPIKSTPEPTSKVASFAGLTGPKPATWIGGPPTSQFSVAEYTVPGVDNADQAKLTVFSAGGTLDANIARWKMQFRDTDGTVGGVDPQLESFEAGGMPVHFVELAGDYRGANMANYAVDQLFFMAVVEAPAQQLFIRLVGPRATVEPNREAFMQLVKGLKEAEPEK